MDSSMDPELQALADRIAAVRTAIDAEKRARAEIEETQLPFPEDPSETALEALREEVTRARAKLVKLQGKPVPKRTEPKETAAESSERSGLYFTGVLVALPGLVTLGAMLYDHIAHPEIEALAPSLAIIFALPLILGLLILGRARFAKNVRSWDFL